MITTSKLTIATKGDSQIISINNEVVRFVADSGLNEGIATIFITGTTAGVMVMEHEPGLVEDLETAMERLIPRQSTYQHNVLNHDDNGHSHTRACLLGPSVVIPFADKRPLLGTWQEIVIVDFDSRPRSREVILQLLGE